MLFRSLELWKITRRPSDVVGPDNQIGLVQTNTVGHVGALLTGPQKTSSEELEHMEIKRAGTQASAKGPSD